MTKRQRLALIFERFQSKPACTSADQALGLLNEVISEIEAQHCPENEEPMGGPLDDSRRAVPNRTDITRYRNKGHNTFVQANGAIRIEEVGTKTLVYEKAGADGKKVFDP